MLYIADWLSNRQIMPGDETVATEKVRVGVIGASASYGWAVRGMMPALEAVDGCELVAVCTAHPETARASAEKWGAPLAFHDHRELIARSDVDAVIVSVRVPYHCAMSVDALNAGKHVYTEWPMARNVDEAIKMLSVAKASGAHHMVGLQTRAAPIWLQAKLMIEEGYVGQVLSAHLTYFEAARFKHPADRVYHADRAAGVNTLTVTAGHALDTFACTVGEFADFSSVVGTQVKQWETTDTRETVNVTAPDHIMVTGKLRSGAIATVRVAAVPHHSPGIQLEVYGSEGTLVLTSSTRTSGDATLVGGHGDDSKLAPIAIPRTLSVVPQSASISPQEPAYYVAQLLQRFVTGILTGKPAAPDFQTGAQRMALLAAIEHASESGERQAVRSALSTQQ